MEGKKSCKACGADLDNDVADYYNVCMSCKAKGH